MSFFRYVGLGLIGILFAGDGQTASLHIDLGAVAQQGPAQALNQKMRPFSANDVSWLFPAPTRAEDFAKLIAVRDLTTQDPQDPAKRDLVWPYAVFQRFLDIANGPAAQVAGTPSRIALPAEVQTLDAWFVAGIRVDAGAPGLSDEIRSQFGQLPEIRLIVQPVTRNADGTPKVHDIAGHLIFDFTLPPSAPAQAGCLPRRLPDLDAFNAIVRDLDALRTELSDGQFGTDKVTTSGIPLGVYPGLADATTANNVRDAIKSFLEKHISALRLDAMAIAALPAGAHAPWIFLSMVEVPPGVDSNLPNGGFQPVRGPTLDGQQFAQMLEPEGTIPRVLPAPHTNNLNPITCKNAAVSPISLPMAKRAGASTADLFVTPPPPADKTKAVLDLIADPLRSHFFNTDCVSCHTETRRAMELLNVKDFPGINSAVLPNGSWSVRNFGWAPAVRGSFQATVTRRTAAETAAVVTLINSQLIARQPAMTTWR
ncbi:MAG: hypothetical protein WCA27_05530 [Candidatus Sulfotelmatobacter sp.]